MSLSPAQLGELIDRQWGPLRGWIGSCAGAEDDILQEAFIRLAEQDPAPTNPVAWLYSVTRNLARNEHKSRRRRKRRHEIVATRGEVDEWSSRQVESSELWEQLTRLEDGQREIVVARIWGGLSFEEIGELVGSSAATVWRRYQEALTRLRNLYGVTCQTHSE